MQEKRFHGDISRLRSPERLELMEVERVVDLSLEGINARTMLDVGTGTGVFAEAFGLRGIMVSGIDPNPEMLAAAQKYVPQGDFQPGTVEEIPFEDGSFDLVFLVHILHESDDLLKALQEVKRVTNLRVSVLEWPYQVEEFGPPLEHRLKPEQVEEQAQQAGFICRETVILSHMVLYRFDITCK
jgi:ubiquinone/menaquinone biosynthesis C-methylase UbiE